MGNNQRRRLRKIGWRTGLNLETGWGFFVALNDKTRLRAVTIGGLEVPEYRLLARLQFRYGGALSEKAIKPTQAIMPEAWCFGA